MIFILRASQASKVEIFTGHEENYQNFAVRLALISTTVLISSNFPFFHSVFHPFGELFAIFIKF